MVRKPGLFNEALAGFYRSTEAVAKRRADEADPGSLMHPGADEIPGVNETDARWLDTRQPEGGPR
jgi:hypothetical protein